MAKPYATATGKAGRTENHRASLGGTACQCDFSADNFQYAAITCQFSGIQSFTDNGSCFDFNFCRRSAALFLPSGTFVVPFKSSFPSPFTPGDTICRYELAGISGFPCGPGIPCGTAFDSICFDPLCRNTADYIRVDVRKRPTDAFLTAFVYVHAPVLIHGFAYPPQGEGFGDNDFSSECSAFGAPFPCSCEYIAGMMAFRAGFTTFPETTGDERTLNNQYTHPGSNLPCNSSVPPRPWNNIGYGGQVILQPGP